MWTSSAIIMGASSDMVIQNPHYSMLGNQGINLYIFAAIMSKSTK
ncbi:hypothetical protein RintRC_1207 [Richelia intracellularis]|nr:hypothetical protein RintRC_1207 [Richelia intracellularis]